MALGRIIERIRSEESGFTLVELCVVMLVSIVIVIALLTYQDIVLRQTTRVFAKVDATQRARTAMETIETRLRSSCMAEDVTPIQTGSTGTSLSFVSKYGSAASLTRRSTRFR
jgi:Tfp pilus assembly protein PilE